MTRFASLRASVIGAAVLCAGIGAFPSVSLANLDGSYTINNANFTNCSAGCGTVTIAGDGTKDVTFTISITNSLSIHGVSATSDTFAFSVSDTPTVGISGNNGGNWSTTLNSPNGATDGFGKFNDSVGCAGTSAGNPCGTQVTIDLTSGSNLTLSDSSTGFPFAIALTQSTATVGCTGACTGFASVPGPALGAGLPGLLAACGALVMLGRRRRSAQIA